MRQRSVALCALLLAAPATAPAQEPVLLRIGGGAGQAVHSRMVMDMRMRGGPLAATGADSTLPAMHMVMFVTQTLDGVSADTLTYTAVVDSMHAESPGMPQLGPGLEQAMATAPRRTTVRMDPRGHFMSPVGDAGASVPPAAVPPGALMSGGLGPGGLGYALPERAVRVGESWNDSLRVTLQAGARTTAARTEYRLERIEPRGSAGTAIVSMHGTVEVSADGFDVAAPFSGLFSLDVAARRMTGMAMSLAYSLETPAGPVVARIEIAQAELGDTALTPPPVAEPAPAALPPPSSAGAAPPPRPATADSTEPEGVEISPAPARFTVVRLGLSDGQLNALLAEHVRRARAAGRRAFAEFDADWCGPCRSLKRYLGDSRMVEAFDGTYIIKLNLDRWQARLAGTGFAVEGIPVFFELDDAGRPTGRSIDGGAWGEDIPQNMAPPLTAFFQHRAR